MDRNSPEGKAEEQKHGKRVRVPGMEEFLVEAGSEASVAESPRLGKMGNEPAQEVVAEVALREEEEEEILTSSENVSRPLLVLPLGRKRLSGHRVGVVELCKLRKNLYLPLSVRLQRNSYRLQVISSLSILSLVSVTNSKSWSADEEDDQVWDDFSRVMQKMWATISIQKAPRKKRKTSGLLAVLK